MTQCGVAALEKGKPFPSNCALSWIIWVALNPSILTYWATGLHLLRNECRTTIAAHNCRHPLVETLEIIDVPMRNTRIALK